MNLTKKIEADARKANACAQGREALLTINPENREAMVDLFFKHIDFCLNNNFPANDFITKYGKGVIENKGLFVDKDVELVNVKDVALLGQSSGVAKYDDYAVGRVYVKHTSAVDIEAHGNSFVMIDAFDDATVNVRTYDRAKVCVNQYTGAKVNVISSTEESVVKIREKHSKIYI